MRVLSIMVLGLMVQLHRRLRQQSIKITTKHSRKKIHKHYHQKRNIILNNSQYVNLGKPSLSQSQNRWILFKVSNKMLDILYIFFAPICASICKKIYNHKNGSEMTLPPLFETFPKTNLFW